ncbi:MAG: transporter permease [Haloplasmataceae bacterium]|jgi:multiple sugar transport system permease protein|nr:transporter permease [Haloplasmataceae bacterium]
MRIKLILKILKIFKNLLTLKTRKSIIGYLFIMPWMIGFIVFAVYPILYSFYLSLHFVKFTSEGTEMVYWGFKNFQRAFAVDQVMLLYLYAFLKDSLIMIVIINVFALIFALILNLKIKGRGFFRVVFFLPVIIVSGPLINELVSQEILVLPGIANFKVIQMFREIFGLQFSELIISIFSRLIYMFWFSGVQIIVFLAILQKLNKEIYEAAEIDGASPWESFWKITLPYLKPIFLINIIYTFIMLATFADNKVIIKIYNSMFNSTTDVEGFGYASALAWIYFVALFLVILIIFLIFSIKRGTKHKVSFYSDGYVYNKTRYVYKNTMLNTNKKAIRAKKFVLGKRGLDGMIAKGFIYLLIITVAFSFLYPFIYLLLKSLQSPSDVLDPTVGLIPSKLYFNNFTKSFKAIGFMNALKGSLSIAFFPSLAQVISTALMGYGLSRFDFKGKKVIIVLVLITFIIPPQILMIPTYLLYKKLGILKSILSFILPALFGQGFKSAIFIMLFYQFFNLVPKVLDEAAEIDGASPMKIFIKITLPLTIPSIIVVFLFSFVWYWNETYLTALYMEGAKTLPIQLSRFADSFKQMFPVTGDNGTGYVDTLNEAILMAGTLISILPLLLIYFLLQKWFVEGVDRSGITGE